MIKKIYRTWKRGGTNLRPRSAVPVGRTHSRATLLPLGGTGCVLAVTFAGFSERPAEKLDADHFAGFVSAAAWKRALPLEDFF